MSASLKVKIAEVFDEPGCDRNQAKSAKERKKGCTKQLSPGAAAGGCAFDGAKIALQPIADAAHLVHGPIACEGNSWDNRHSASSGPQIYRTGFTTDIGEFDVIYGGEKRLFKSIREIVEKYDPPAVFVYQTCVTALIGDEVEAVCQRASAKFGKPVIPVNAPGFAGPKNLGNKLGGEALLDYVIGTREPEFTTPCDINIIGEYNLVGELWQVRPLLDALGIRVLACICGDGRYNDIASAHRAKVNMVVCSKSMINIATRMQQRWGIPYFEGSFYGISDMSHALREIARLLAQQGAGDDLRARAERLIAVEEARAAQRIAAYRERLAGRRVLLITGGVKSWSVVSALQEAGLEIVGTSVKKSTREDKEKIRELMGGDAHMIDDMTPRQMYDLLRDAKADIMLSGGRTQFVALKARMPWLDINQERHHPYAGYEGMVALVHEIDRALRNPVWQQVRIPAPWGDDGQPLGAARVPGDAAVSATETVSAAGRVDGLGTGLAPAGALAADSSADVAVDAPANASANAPVNAPVLAPANAPANAFAGARADTPVNTAANASANRAVETTAGTAAHAIALAAARAAANSTAHTVANRANPTAHGMANAEANTVADFAANVITNAATGTALRPDFPVPASISAETADPASALVPHVPTAAHALSA